MNTLLYIDGQWPGGTIRIEIFNFKNNAGEWIVKTSGGLSPRFSLYEGQTLYYAGDEGLLNSQAGSGKVVVIEANNEYIKGTFEFISSISPFTNIKRTVTEGAFQVKRMY